MAFAPVPIKWVHQPYTAYDAPVHGNNSEFIRGCEELVAEKGFEFLSGVPGIHKRIRIQSRARRLILCNEEFPVILAARNKNNDPRVVSPFEDQGLLHHWRQLGSKGNGAYMEIDGVAYRFFWYNYAIRISKTKSLKDMPNTAFGDNEIGKGFDQPDENRRNAATGVSPATRASMPPDEPFGSGAESPETTQSDFINRCYCLTMDGLTKQAFDEEESPLTLLGPKEIAAVLVGEAADAEDDVLLAAINNTNDPVSFNLFGFGIRDEWIDLESHGQDKIKSLEAVPGVSIRFLRFRDVKQENGRIIIAQECFEKQK